VKNNQEVPPPPSREFREALETQYISHNKKSNGHERTENTNVPEPPNYFPTRLIRKNAPRENSRQRQNSVPNYYSRRPTKSKPFPNHPSSYPDQAGAFSRAATGFVRGVNTPFLRPQAKPPTRHALDRRDPFLHLMGLGGIAALLGGGFLTINAFGGSLAGWIAAFSLTTVQIYCRRSAKTEGWTILYGAGFLFTTLFSSYFNLIGLLNFHGYTFDFRPLSGILWKSMEKLPQPIELYMLIIYFFAALVIDVLAEPLCMRWFELFFPPKPRW
jgi:hypothetical protein